MSLELKSNVALMFNIFSVTLTGTTNMYECDCFSLYVGAASKRFGIDGDREAVPLMLEVMYNKVR